MILLAATMCPTDAVLDNPVYAALSSTHARFALVRGHARRYPDDIAPFAALPSQPSAKDWQDAAALVVPGTFVAVLHTGVELPEGWQAVRFFEAVQMVEDGTTGADCPEAVSLGAADVPEMLRLVNQTQPGPFLPRTIELGTYLGFRRDGALVAMAGERFRLGGWTEVSAVCTIPGYRGRGLASRLVRGLIAGIDRRSERAFLHVLASNTDAISLYQRLGFRARRSATIAVMMPMRSATP